MNTNQKVLTWVWVALIAVLLLMGRFPGEAARSASAAAPGATDAQIGAAECASGRSVQTSGSATIQVVPDQVTIRLGVQSNGGSIDEVQRNNSTAMERVVKTLRNNGIEEKDIATQSYVIEPVYDDYNSLYIKGYRIHNLLEVTLREVKRAGEVVAAALKAGANQVISVEFSTSELRKYRDQARELAAKAAREKAQALAKAVDAEAGCALNISENTWSYYNSWWYGGSQTAWTQNVVQNAGPAQPLSEGGEGETISLGRISVKAEVSVTFTLQ
jgi:hypothetical protein